jgi:hypothetical protein
LCRSYGLKKQIISGNIGGQTKCALHETLVRPVLTYVSESWTLRRKDETMLRIFEGKIFRRIDGPIKENGICRSRYTHELYKFNNEPDTVKVLEYRSGTPAGS